MNGQLNATRLRSVLIVVMILIVVGACAGFLFVHNNLNDYATTISRLNADANSGDQNLQTLRNLQTRLEKEQTTIENAHAIVADKSRYADQALSDIGRIANESGVSLTTFEFVESQTAATTTPTTTQPAASTSGGVKKKVVTVTLDNPVDYTKLMTFIRKIEANTLKMQITSVSLTKDEGNLVTTPTLSIEVYARQ